LEHQRNTFIYSIVFHRMCILLNKILSIKVHRTLEHANPRACERNKNLSLRGVFQAYIAPRSRLREGASRPRDQRGNPRFSRERRRFRHAIVTGGTAVRDTTLDFRDRIGDTGQMPPLPPGWSAVDVGRVGLWLLSRRSHRAAQKRIAFPARVRSGTRAQDFARLILPWHAYEYPGATRFLAGLLGIKASYAKNLLKPSWGRKLPVQHARRLAQYLEGHASACDALAHELRQYADAADRRRSVTMAAFHRHA